ncbi:MAG: HNH endonuclease [Myxococcaceae bacterium]|nr:MAG: HNH endonuclease [Myxococcaceae bacterium]
MHRPCRSWRATAISRSPSATPTPRTTGSGRRSRSSADTSASRVFPTRLGPAPSAARGSDQGWFLRRPCSKQLVRLGSLLDESCLGIGPRFLSLGWAVTSMPNALPSAEQQLQFLVQVQRLLAEGSFVSTYKFALLLALADLAVEKGDDSEAELSLPLKTIAEKVITLYWRQTLPYVGPVSGQPTLLQQRSNGQHATILDRIVETRQATAASLGRARQHASWSGLIKEVAGVLKGYPLTTLQKVGGGHEAFLYDEPPSSDHIVLKPGVAYSFCRFHELIEDMAQGAWLRFVRRLDGNQAALGQVSDLHEFLFGSERADLADYRPLLAAWQSDRCFYCGTPLHGPGQVDHFVPWARYSIDLGHNFVLAHGDCNNDKSDLLPDVEHLRHWCERNEQQGHLMAEAFQKHGLPHDLEASRQIARWAYAQTEVTAGLVWLRKKDSPLALDASWRSLLGPTTAPAT